MLYPNPYLYATDPAISPSTASDLTVAAERASKRANQQDGISSPRSAKRVRRVGPTSHSSTASPLMNAPHGAMQMHTDPALMGQAASPASKPRRVRTGCLTCRERHLKCDEAQPLCQNCRKSNRQCKRGVRLNFIDTTVRQPPIMTPIHDWEVNFLDESREIASEYVGGFERYAHLDRHETAYQAENGLLLQYAPQGMLQQGHDHQIPSIQGLPDPFGEENQQQREAAQQFRAAQANAAYAMASLNSLPSYGYVDQPAVDEKRESIQDPKELSYMQAFVEEVGLWMDAMDTDKHVREVSETTKAEHFTDSCAHSSPSRSLCIPCRILCSTMLFLLAARDIYLYLPMRLQHMPRINQLRLRTRMHCSTTIPPHHIFCRLCNRHPQMLAVAMYSTAQPQPRFSMCMKSCPKDTNSTSTTSRVQEL